MDLNEYIRQSYKRPNRKVLEGLGASEELIKYLMETPGNTNLSVVKGIKEAKDDYWQFVFNLTEIESRGEIHSFLASSNTNDFNDMLNSINDGKILKVSNLIGNITVNDGTDTITIDNLNESFTYRHRLWADNFTMDELCFGNWSIMSTSKIDGFVILGLELDVTDGELQFSVTLDDGYIIAIKNQEEDDIISYFIPIGGSWTCTEDNLTDGTNTYQTGDVITPTSDIELFYVSD